LLSAGPRFADQNAVSRVCSHSCLRQRRCSRRRSARQRAGQSGHLAVPALRAAGPAAASCCLDRQRAQLLRLCRWLATTARLTACSHTLAPQQMASGPMYDDPLAPATMGREFINRPRAPLSSYIGASEEVTFPPGGGRTPTPWDPLRFSELYKVSANNPDVAWLRESELKHGRMVRLKNCWPSLTHSLNQSFPSPCPLSHTHSINHLPDPALSSTAVQTVRTFACHSHTLALNSLPCAHPLHPPFPRAPTHPLPGLLSCRPCSPSSA
jgi:hypothetical protein